MELHPGVVTASGGGTTNFLRADGTWQAPAGMAGITALTGDGTATGPGSVALTLATVNSNVGSFGSSTSIPSFTVNGKGLITAASSNVVIAPAGTLSGTTLNATVVTSSLTAVGTIGTGVWQGTPVVPQYGGTGLATLTAYALIAAGTTSTGTFQQVSGLGSSGQVLTSNGAGALPTWQAAGSSGGFAYLSSNTSVYGGTNSTLSFTGADNTVIGVTAGNALSGGADNTLLGYLAGEALVSGGQNVVIGSNAGKKLTSSSNVFVGYNVDNNTITSGANNVLIGTGWSTGNWIGTSNSNVFIGQGIVAGDAVSNSQSNQCVAVGMGSTARATATTARCTAIGANATAVGFNNVGNISAFGANSGAGGAYSTIVGTFSADNSHANCIVLGQAASGNTSCFVVGSNQTNGNSSTTSASNQIAFGMPTSTYALKDLFLGNGAAAVAAPSNVSIQPTPGTGSNVTGGNILVTAGNGTGSGGSGNISFQTAPIAGSTSTPNTLATVLQLNASGSVQIGATGTTPTHVLNTNNTVGSGVGTWTNVPGAAGNPAGYIQITINGTTSYIPYFQ